MGATERFAKLLLSFYQSPGDTLVATAAIESLANQYPGRFAIKVEGTATELLENNPHVQGFDGSPDLKIRMENELINQSHRPIHFMASYCHTLSKALNLPLDLSVARPYLYVSEQEQMWISQVQEVTGRPLKYWVVSSGVKQDYTVKGWGHHNYQAVVDALAGKIQFVQVGEASHDHKPLRGVIDLRGKTDIRQLVRLCWNAQGGLGGESFLHHIFAGLAKPFVCLVSGFLPRHWITYPTTMVLSRQGQLVCCKEGACWKARVVAIGDGDGKDSNLCSLPVFGEETIPKCMAMIQPTEVVDTIMNYYLGGLLSL